MKARSAKFPGQSAAYLLQNWADQVGRDGVQGKWSRKDSPPCAQAYFNRVLSGTGSGSVPASQRRDRRELETLRLILDKFALGEFKGTVRGGRV